LLECETGFWELWLGILGALSSWLVFIIFTKIVELRFAEFVLLDELLEIKFWIKYLKETLWFHLEHLQYEILTPDITYLNTETNFVWLKFKVYTVILNKLSLKLIILFTVKILFLNFLHQEWINSFILSLVHEW